MQSDIGENDYEKITASHKQPDLDHTPKVSPPSSTDDQLSEEDLFKVISILQKMEKNDREIASSKLLDRLTNLLNTSKTFKASKLSICSENEKIFNFIDELFGDLAHHCAFNEIVQPLIYRLKLPIAKVVLKDKIFFENSEYSGRLLINALLHLMAGITAEISEQENPLYLWLDAMIDEIATHEDICSEFFNEVYHKLNHFVKDLDYKTNSCTRSSRESVEALIDNEIQSRLGHDNIPKSTKLLLERVWKNVMIGIYYDYSKEEDDDWNKAVNFIPAMIWSVKPKRTNIEKQTLMKIIPGLIKTFKHGLNRIAYPEGESKVVLKELSDAQLFALEKLDTYDPEEVDESAYKSYEELTVYHQIKSVLESKNGQELDDDAVEEEIKRQMLKLKMNYFSQVTFFPYPMDTGRQNQTKMMMSKKYTSADYSLISLINKGGSNVKNNNYDSQTMYGLKNGDWIEFFLEKNTIRGRVTWIDEEKNSFICLTQNGRIIQMTEEKLGDVLQHKQGRILQSSSIFDDALKEKLQTNSHIYP